MGDNKKRASRESKASDGASAIKNGNRKLAASTRGSTRPPRLATKTTGPSCEILSAPSTITPCPVHHKIVLAAHWMMWAAARVPGMIRANTPTDAAVLHIKAEL